MSMCGRACWGAGAVNLLYCTSHLNYFDTGHQQTTTPAPASPPSSPEALTPPDTATIHPPSALTVSSHVAGSDGKHVDCLPVLLPPLWALALAAPRPQLAPERPLACEARPQHAHMPVVSEPGIQLSGVGTRLACSLLLPAIPWKRTAPTTTQALAACWVLLHCSQGQPAPSQCHPPSLAEPASSSTSSNSLLASLRRKKYMCLPARVGSGVWRYKKTQTLLTRCQPVLLPRHPACYPAALRPLPALCPPGPPPSIPPWKLVSATGTWVGEAAATACAAPAPVAPVEEATEYRSCDLPACTWRSMNGSLFFCG